MVREMLTIRRLFYAPKRTEVKFMKITMARGDVYSFSFAVYIDDEPTAETMDNIYFTVKKHYYDKDPVFQKRLSDGSIHDEGDGEYSVMIDPEDTDELELGAYDFDIEIVKLPEIKRTFTGTLELTKEVTHRRNEVS